MAKRSTAKRIDKAMARVRESAARHEPDLSSKRKAALLELNLGRRCALAGALAWATMALLATLIYALDPTFSVVDPLQFLSFFRFLLPLGPALAGLAVGGAGLMSKRGSLLRGHLFELHNLAMMLGIIVSAMIAFVAIGVQAGATPATAGLYSHPLGVLGITLGMLGFILTWSGWSERKIVAVLCSVAPTLLALPYLFYPTNVAVLVVWEYAVGGGLFMAAGVIFVVSMTATTGAEREIVKGANERVAMEYARVQARSSEVEAAILQNSERAAQLGAEAAQLEERKRRSDEHLAQAEGVKSEAEKLFADATKASAESRTKLAALQGKAAALEAKERELAATEARRATGERQLLELQKVLNQERQGAEAARHKAEQEKQLATVELGHAKRERDAARATLLSAEQKAREADALITRSQEEKRQLEESRRMLGAQSQTADSARVRALEDLQKQLSADRGKFDQERKAFSDERARVTQEAKAVSEQKLAFEARGRDLDARERNVTESMTKIANEKAEIEAARRRADSALAEAGAQSKSHADSMAKASELEARAQELGGQVASQEKRMKERELKLKEYEKEIAQKNEQNVADRRTLTGKLEQMKLKEERLKEWETALFQLEKTPEFAKEAAKALAREIEEAERPSDLAPVHMLAPQKPGAQGDSPPASDRLSFGNQRLDDLTGGGLPKGSSLLVVGPAFCGKETIPLGFISAGLSKGIPAIIVTTTKSTADIAEELAAVSPGPSKGKVRDLVRWVDCSAKNARGDIPKDHVIEVASPADFTKIQEAIATHFRAFERISPTFRFAYVSLTASWQGAEPTVARNFLQRMVAAVKNKEGGGIYIAESGIHSADEVESLANTMHGVIRCQEDKTGHSMRVQGIPGTKPHHWVQYRPSPKGIDLGSFELERIR